MAFKKMNVTIKGVAPLIMHNARLVDPFDPFAREKGRLAKGKAKKTDEGQMAISRVEWCGGLYHTDGEVAIGDGEVVWDKAMRVVLPATNLLACTIEGAKAAKLGKTFKAAVFVPEDALLEYDGPKDINDLMKDTRFISRKPAKQQQSKIMRTRPIFRQWKATFAVEFNTELVNDDQVLEAIMQAGRTCGLGDWKPQHGRFEIV